ncbi:MAG: accessory factor UbiK family protein [Bdellovibrionales bacterium]
MIKPDSKVLDDVARLAGGAVGIVSEVRQSIHSDIKERLEQTAANLDLVPRDEFERLELLVKEQQKEILSLQELLSKLEKNKK